MHRLSNVNLFQFKGSFLQNIAPCKKCQQMYETSNVNIYHRVIKSTNFFYLTILFRALANFKEVDITHTHSQLDSKGNITGERYEGKSRE